MNLRDLRYLVALADTLHFGKAGLEENQDYRATSLETLRQLVAAGYGVTLLPKLATRGATTSQGVAIKTLPRPAPHRTIGAVWRKSSTRTAAIHAVSDVIRNTLADTP